MDGSPRLLWARIYEYARTWQSYTLPIPSWQEHMAILPGTRLGSYEVVAQIGAGEYFLANSFFIYRKGLHTHLI